MKYFSDVRFPGDWEYNFRLGRLQLRIGRSQVALWYNYRPLFCWLANAAA